MLDILAEIESLKADLQQTADAAESATTQLREEIAAMTRAEEERKQSAEMAAMQLQLAATEADMKVGELQTRLGQHAEELERQRT